VSEANTEAGIAVKIITEQHATAVLAVFLIFILSVPPLVLKKTPGSSVPYHSYKHKNADTLY
jgi:hypothetical protein